MKDTWKAFGNNEITHSDAHYLMAIGELLASHGYARVTDVAKKLNITHGSCSITLKKLKKKGLVVEDDNKFLHLPPESQQIAKEVKKTDEIVIDFLTTVLGVQKKQAEIDACKVEHLLSRETAAKLCRFLDYLDHQASLKQKIKSALSRQEVDCHHYKKSCVLCSRHKES